MPSHLCRIVARSMETTGLPLAVTTTADDDAVVTHVFAKRLARSLAGRPAYAFGIDSLVAVGLLFSFLGEIRADLPVMQILGGSTMAELGAVAAVKSEH